MVQGKISLGPSISQMPHLKPGESRPLFKVHDRDSHVWSCGCGCDARLYVPDTCVMSGPPYRFYRHDHAVGHADGKQYFSAWDEIADRHTLRPTFAGAEKDGIMAGKATAPKSDDTTQPIALEGTLKKDDEPLLLPGLYTTTLPDLAGVKGLTGPSGPVGVPVRASSADDLVDAYRIMEERLAPAFKDCTRQAMQTLYGPPPKASERWDKGFGEERYTGSRLSEGPSYNAMFQSLKASEAGKTIQKLMDEAIAAIHADLAQRGAVLAQPCKAQVSYDGGVTWVNDGEHASARQGGYATHIRFEAQAILPTCPETVEIQGLETWAE